LSACAYRAVRLCISLRLSRQARRHSRLAPTAPKCTDQTRGSSTAPTTRRLRPRRGLSPSPRLPMDACLPFVRACPREQKRAPTPATCLRLLAPPATARRTASLQAPAGAAWCHQEDPVECRSASGQRRLPPTAKGAAATLTPLQAAPTTARRPWCLMEAVGAAEDSSCLESRATKAVGVPEAWHAGQPGPTPPAEAASRLAERRAAASTRETRALAAAQVAAEVVTEVAMEVALPSVPAARHRHLLAVGSADQVQELHKHHAVQSDRRRLLRHTPSRRKTRPGAAGTQLEPKHRRAATPDSKQPSKKTERRARTSSTCRRRSHQPKEAPPMRNRC